MKKSKQQLSLCVVVVLALHLFESVETYASDLLKFIEGTEGQEPVLVGLIDQHPVFLDTTSVLQSFQGAKKLQLSGELPPPHRSDENLIANLVLNLLREECRRHLFLVYGIVTDATAEREFVQAYIVNQYGDALERKLEGIQEALRMVLDKDGDVVISAFEQHVSFLGISYEEFLYFVESMYQAEDKELFVSMFDVNRISMLSAHLAEGRSVDHQVLNLRLASKIFNRDIPIDDLTYLPDLDLFIYRYLKENFQVIHPDIQKIVPHIDAVIKELEIFERARKSR